MTKHKSYRVIFFAVLFIASSLQAKEIRTNELIIPEAPTWLGTSRVESITAKIQHRLEWSIRRIKVEWYANPSAFAQAQSMGPQALALTVTSEGASKILMGPKVNNENFDEVLGHELVHVISNQKYKGAIPPWLEEGLANHIAMKSKVDYKWLAKQPAIDDVHHLAHPFSGSEDGIHYRYMASQALAEMLSKSCDLENLIRLSVERKMENYIDTYCGIHDLNAAFKNWVAKQAGRAP